MTTTHTATTTRTVATLTELATRTESNVLNSAIVVLSFHLPTCVVDLAVSRRGGRIIRSHVLEIGPGGRWLHFTGTPSANAKAALAAIPR